MVIDVISTLKVNNIVIQTRRVGLIVQGQGQTQKKSVQPADYLRSKSTEW